MNPVFLARDPESKSLTLDFSDCPTPSVFNSLAYARACKRVGLSPVIFAMADNGTLLNGCVAVMRGHRLVRNLEIPSTPSIQSHSAFWAGVLDYCRKNRIAELMLNSFGSIHPSLPDAKPQTVRMRREFALDLKQPDLVGAFSSNNRRNLRKAQKSGVVLERSTSIEAGNDHLRLMQASMTRRADRGEDVSGPAHVRFQRALVDESVGEFFRAKRGNETLSSVFVIRGEHSAYYHSAGTSPDGMSVGAAAFLIGEIARTLSQDGLSTFNLGGANPEEEGLYRFKSGFGATEISLESRTLTLMSRTKRTLLRAIGYLVRTS